MKKVIYILAALWLVILLRLTVFRNNCFSHGLCSGRVEWAAFFYYLRLARAGRWGYFCYLFFGNLLWFAPVGIYVRILELWNTRQIAGAAGAGNADGKVPFLPRGADGSVPSLRHRSSLLRAALWGFLLSLLVETGQFVLGSGVSELDDLILNTCGAVLGYAAACLFCKKCKKIKSPIDKKPQDIDNRG